jgi:hypothetical protein
MQISVERLTAVGGRFGQDFSKTTWVDVSAYQNTSVDQITFPARFLPPAVSRISAT